MIGQTVDHYRITEKLGEGGMGEVYLAEDTSLRRKVAVKFLPTYLENDETARLRFIREARSAAAIDHPYICKIYEVGEVDNKHYIVMEYVQGHTLQDKIAQGRVPVRQALQIASETAEAIDRAHQQGIVHRDLKPSNIILVPDGHVKVMDFGLAKRLHTGGHEEITAALTREGTTLGTLAYMSPEQLKGKPVDTRSDIFSFGVVLYEMLTGVHPFRTGTQAETVNAILNEYPSALSRYTEESSDILQYTIEKMLSKDSEERYQSIREVRTNLKKLAEKLSLADVTSARAKTKTSIWVGTVTALALLVAALVFFWPKQVAELTPDEEIEIIPFTSDGTLKASPQLSPDGNHVAYFARVGPVKSVWRAGDADIFVKSIGEGTRPLQLTSRPETEICPVWSPNGERIAFIRKTEQGDALYTIPAFGGQGRKVADLGLADSSRLSLSALTWSSDGMWLAKAEVLKDQPFRIILISPETGKKRPLTNPPRGIVGDTLPSFSPDGSQLAFVRSSGAHSRDLWLCSLESSEARQVTFEEYGEILQPAWTPDGQEIILAAGGVDSETRLLRIPVDGGMPRPVVGVGTGAKDPSVRRDRLVFVQEGFEAGDIWRIAGPASEAKRGPTQIIRTNPRFHDENMAVSPDSQNIAFVSSRTGAPEIWLAKADGSDPVQLSHFGSLCESPAWSPGGQQIVFYAEEGGEKCIYVVDTEGGEPRALMPDAGRPSYSRNGRWIYFSSNRSGDIQIWKMAAEGGEAVPITTNGGDRPLESLDGDHLYYFKSNRDGHLGGIWRVPVEGGEEVQILDELLTDKNWDLQANRLYYSKKEWPKRSSIHFLDLNTGEKVEMFRQEVPAAIHTLSAAPDGRWIYYGSFDPARRVADIMLVENFR